ncbi:hypothetical protein ACFL5Q_04060 [Planctomycetota bacterium]
MGLFDWLTRKPSLGKFAESLVAGLQAAGDTRQFQYDRDKSRLLYEGGEINLGAMFAEHCQLSKSQRGDHLNVMVRAMLPAPPLPEDFADASHDLRPRIWARKTLSHLDADKLPPHHAVGSHLTATLVYDLPDSVRTIAETELEAWGVNYYEALEVARAQLTQDNFMFASIGGSVHCSITGDTYDASRLLLVELIRRLSVKGTPIAMVPQRDQLFLTGSDDVDGLRLILKRAEDGYREAARPLCPLPLRLDDDQWVDWMPDGTHPLYQEFRDFELKVLYGDYEEQKTELEELHGESVFVATFAAAQKDDRLVSFSTWSKGVPTLLPKTQRVGLVDPERKDVVASGPWEHVQSVVGHLMKQTDDYPARYLVEEFPTDDQLAAIGKEEP